MDEETETQNLSDFFFWSHVASDEHELEFKSVWIQGSHSFCDTMVTSLVLKEVFDFYIFYTSTIWICPCILVSLATITNYQKLDGSNNRNVFPHSSGGSKSVSLGQDQSVGRAIHPLDSSGRGESVFLPLPASSGSWQSMICHTTPISSSVSHLLLCDTPPLPLSYKDTCDDI